MNNLDKLKVCILYGGWSDERSISLESGKNVYDCLLEGGLSVNLFDFHTNDKELLLNFLKKNSINLVFNLMHGVGGEDGLVQSYLDDLAIKYVGSNSKSSQLSFDKILTKEIWKKNNLPTPDWIKLNKNSNYTDIVKRLNEPFIIKPSASGSSVGIQIIKSEEIFNTYLNESSHLENTMIEKIVNGFEYTAPIINDEVFPIIKIETKREFYDYNAKYIDNDTLFTFPSFSEDNLDEIKQTVLRAFKSVGCTKLGRVDFFIDTNNKIQLIEINTIPGMTSHSLVPMSSKEKNISFLDLIISILLEE